MKKIIQFILNYWSILLYSWVPILFLFNANFDLVLPVLVLRPLVSVFLFSLLITIAVAFALKDSRKTYIVVQITMLCVFFYLPLNDFIIWPYIFIYTLLVYAVVSGIYNFGKISSFLFRLFLILFIFNSFGFIKNTITFYRKESLVSPKVTSQLNSDKLGYKPDIYLIVLDGRARTDVLKNIYSYDTPQLEQFLKEKNFYINDNSTNNYAQTYLSMFSLFQMDYLNLEKEGISTNQTNRTKLLEGIINSDTVNNLKSYGYKFRVLDSGWAGSSVLKKIDTIDMLGGNINEVEMVILNNSILASIGGGKLPYLIHATRINQIFSSIPRTAKNPEPTFTYAHILVPHPPFVFDEKGNLQTEKRYFTFHDSELKLMNILTKEEYKQKYINQLKYTDTKVEMLVNEILEQSDKPPIIYIMSDHGPGAEFTYYDVSDLGIYERFSNFSAVYYPDQNYSVFSQVKSPVNMFRVMFNQYFGTNFTYLPDDTKNTSAWYSPFNFTDVTERYNKILSEFTGK